MKNIKNILLLLLLAFVVAGCNPASDSESKDEDSADSSAPIQKESIQDLIDMNPKVETAWKALPEDFRKKVVMPEVRTFPFKVEDIQVLTVAAGVLPPGEKTNFDIMYKSKNSFPRIHVTTFDVEGQKSSFGAYTAKVGLADGIEGYYSEKGKETKISWLSEDNSIRYNVRYMDGVNGKDSITRENLIEITNSMIKKTK